MDWKTNLLLILLAALIFSSWRYDNLKDKYTAETAAHTQTEKDLTDAIEKGQGWMDAYGKAYDSAEFHRKATQACLNREVEARKAEQEREKILQAAQTHPRSKEEQEQVVDDETRKRTAYRLNRPL